MQHSSSTKRRHVPTAVSRVYWSGTEKNKTFEVRFTDRATGKQRYETVGSFEQAKARLAEIDGKQFKGEKIADATTTLSDVVERWCEVRRLKPRTAESYDRHLRLHILPRLGRVRVRDIDRAVVRRWLAGLPDHLSGGTKAVSLAVLSSLLDHAVEDGALSFNPCRQLSRRDKPKQGTLAPRIVGDGELDKLLAACGRREWLRPIILTALFAGLRLGEIVALDWQDVDFTNNKLTVERALSKDGKTLGTPKGGKTATIDMLLPLRKVLAEIHFAHGRPSSGPVFRNSLGAMRQPRDVQRAFTQARHKAGLSDVPREIRFHDLRHTCASQLANAPGVSLPWVQAHLRHANLATTMGYAHKIESVEAVESAAAALAALA